VKIAEEAQIFDLLISTGRKLCIKFDKNGLGYILGFIFGKASGNQEKCAETDVHVFA
jgi:hypothetical protein